MTHHRFSTTVTATVVLFLSFTLSSSAKAIRISGAPVADATAFGEFEVGEHFETEFVWRPESWSKVGADLLADPLELVATFSVIPTGIDEGPEGPTSIPRFWPGKGFEGGGDSRWLDLGSFGDGFPRVPSIDLPGLSPSHPVPEPSAALLFGLGTTLAGSLVRRRR